MTETVRQLTEVEKAFESFQVVADESFSQDEDPSITNIQKVDAKFQNIFDNLLKKCGKHNRQMMSVNMRGSLT